MRIIGIDPGSRFTGYGLVELKAGQLIYLNHGYIELSGKLNHSSRLLELGGQLGQVFSSCGAEHCVVEKIFFGKSADSAFKLGLARGVCIYEAKKSGMKLFEYATRKVKKSVTGDGNADKHKVQLMVSTWLSIPTVENFDASDALAMAICHATRLRIENQRRKLGEANT